MGIIGWIIFGLIVGAVAKLGLQALLEVNLRLATTDYLSNCSDGLQPSATLPVVLSRTVTSLSAYEVM